MDDEELFEVEDIETSEEEEDIDLSGKPIIWQL